MSVPQRPVLPTVDFDWDVDQWRSAAAQFVELATTISTAWMERRPSPTSASNVQFNASLADSPLDLDKLIATLERDVITESVFNGHPRFFAYITSSPTPIGVLGDMLASALNMNVGIWRLAPAATAIELQTIDWIKDIVGYPATAEGVFVSGGQMANIVAYNVFRDARTPWDTRQFGMRGPDGRAPQLRVYTSDQVHYCHEQAAEMLGMGRDAVRMVPVDHTYRMRVDALDAMIAEDRARGDLPLAIAATAGTVGTGAVDPLPQLVELARAKDLWLHVDGAYGAFGAIAPSAPADLCAMSEADSIACDPHKWLYAPIDAGVTLVRQPGLLQESFAFHASYLQTNTGQVDLIDRSPENSRRFRALKVWMALKLYGRDGYRDMIERNILLASYMARLIEATPGLRLAAHELSIVCWRVTPDGVADPEQLDKLQTEVIAELEARGIAIISQAKLLDDTTALRACIVNFRTTADDVEALITASAEIGTELAARSR
jgi:glutamate/tyrosine decarboxylase-like PLP-dependent enzyme